MLATGGPNHLDALMYLSSVISNKTTPYKSCIIMTIQYIVISFLQVQFGSILQRGSSKAVQASVTSIWRQTARATTSSYSTVTRCSRSNGARTGCGLTCLSTSWCHVTTAPETRPARPPATKRKVRTRPKPSTPWHDAEATITTPLYTWDFVWQ